MSDIRRRGLAAICASLFVYGSLLPAALAQPGPPPAGPADPYDEPAPCPATKEDIYADPDSAPDTVKARELFIAGATLSRQGRWSDAYPLLLEAWKLKGHSQIAFALGHVELELARFRDAAAHLEAALRAPELARPPSHCPDPSAKDRALATEWLAKAKAGLGHIHVEASPPGAQVFIDGASAGAAALSHPIDADPGKHIVELRSGAVSSRKEIELRSGEVTTVTLALPPPPPNAAPAPVAPSMAAAGTPSPFPARTLVLGVSGALAVTGLVAGVAATWQASARGQLAAQSGERVDGPDAVMQSENKDLALGCFVSAGVIGSAALTYYFLTRDTNTPVRAAAAVGPSGGGLLISGQF